MGRVEVRTSARRRCMQRRDQVHLCHPRAQLARGAHERQPAESPARLANSARTELDVWLVGSRSPQTARARPQATGRQAGRRASSPARCCGHDRCDAGLGPRPRSCVREWVLRSGWWVLPQGRAGQRRACRVAPVGACLASPGAAGAEPRERRALQTAMMQRACGGVQGVEETLSCRCPQPTRRPCGSLRDEWARGGRACAVREACVCGAASAGAAHAFGLVHGAGGGVGVGAGRVEPSGAALCVLLQSC